MAKSKKHAIKKKTPENITKKKHMPRLASSTCLFFLLLLIVLPTTMFAIKVSTKGKSEESNVIVLDSSNFSKIVKQHPFVVVEFYAPWCGHCKRLQPEYEKAAKILKSHDPPIILAKVDATIESNKALAEEYQVTGFPTLKIIENQGSSVRDYKGPRDANGITTYLKKQVGPPSEEITSLGQGKKLVEDNNVVVVGIFSSYDCEEFNKFFALAHELRSDYEFRHTLNANFLPEKDTNITSPTIRIFKKFDEGYHDLTNFDIKEAQEFLDEVSIPYVVSFSNDSMQRQYLSKVFSKPNDANVFLFIDVNGDSTSIKEIKQVYTKLAKQYKGKGVRFLLADTEDGKNAIQYFGVQAESFPTLIVQEGDGKKYKFEEAQPDKIEQWLQDYIEGKVPEFYKSQPMPENNDEPVKVVVLDTFESMVLNSQKNVLVKFYAPWCGHCKTLAPILDEVALAFETDPDVMIAKFDVTANDIKHKQFDVKGFPTLYLRTSSGKLVLYEGDRSKEDMINFINSNKDSTTIKHEEADLEAEDEL